MTALKLKTWENIRHHGSLQRPDRVEHQTSWPPFRGQTGQNIRHPQPPFRGQKEHQTSPASFQRPGRTSDILASFQRPDREKHQTSWPPFRGQTGKSITHPGLLSGARQGRTSDILASFEKTKFLLKIVCKRLNI